MRKVQLNSSLFQLLEDGQPRWLVLRRGDSHYDVRFGDYRDPATKLLLRGEGWVEVYPNVPGFIESFTVAPVYGQGEVGDELLNEIADRLLAPLADHLWRKRQLEQ